MVVGDQVRGCTGTARICGIFFDCALAQGTGCGWLEAANFCYRAVVLGKPDGSGGRVGASNTIGFALRGGGGCFVKCVRGRVKFADLVGGDFGKPEIAIVIDGEVKWGGIAGGGRPLVPGVVCGVKLTNGIGHWLGKPDIAAAVDGEEDGAGVIGWLFKHLGGGGTVGKALTGILSDDASGYCITNRGRITFRYSDQDVAIIVKGDAPGVRRWDTGFINGWSSVCVCMYTDQEDQGKCDAGKCCK